MGTLSAAHREAEFEDFHQLLKRLYIQNPSFSKPKD